MEQINDVANDDHLNPTPTEIVLSAGKYNRDHQVIFEIKECGKTTEIRRVFTHWETILDTEGRVDVFDELRFGEGRDYNVTNKRGNALKQAERFLNSFLNGPVKNPPTKLILTVYPFTPNMFHHNFFKRELDIYLVLQTKDYEHLYTLLEMFSHSSTLTIGCPRVLANKYLGTLAFQPAIPVDFFRNPVVRRFKSVTVLRKNNIRSKFTNNRIKKLNLENSDVTIGGLRRKIRWWLNSERYHETEWSVKLQLEEKIHVEEVGKQQAPTKRTDIRKLMQNIPTEIQNVDGRIHTHIVRRASDNRTATVTVDTYTKSVTFTLNA